MVKKDLLKPKTREAITGYTLILPSSVMVAAFCIIPIFMSFYYSFTKFNVLQAPEFVGLRNYIKLFSHPFVFLSIRNTLIYTLVTVPFQTVLSLLLACVFIAKKDSAWKNFAKGSSFIPVICSMIIVGVLWRMMFNSSDDGPINSILGLIGIKPVNWLGGKHTALLSTCIVSLWKNVGYFLVIFYAGINEIPKSYYEAAEVDGANYVQKLFYITIPCLKRITYLVVTLGTIWSFQVFDLVYVMTGGGPGTSTQTLVMTIYSIGFKEYNMGYASALAFLLFTIIIVVSVIQKMFLGKEEGETA